MEIRSIFSNRHLPLDLINVWLCGRRATRTYRYEPSTFQRNLRWQNPDAHDLHCRDTPSVYPRIRYAVGLKVVVVLTVHLP